MIWISWSIGDKFKYSVIYTIDEKKIERGKFTSHNNNEYPDPLYSAQIGSRWSPTSGTRGTLEKKKTVDFLAEKQEKK